MSNTIIVKQTRNLALQQIKLYPHLQEIQQQEPDFMNEVMNEGLAWKNPQMRWHCYEALKQKSLMFVGWGARSPLLQTAQHYQEMLEFIEFLLPIEMSREEFKWMIMRKIEDEIQRQEILHELEHAMSIGVATWDGDDYQISA